jgi:hypothetical protein
MYWTKRTAANIWPLAAISSFNRMGCFVGGQSMDSYPADVPSRLMASTAAQVGLATETATPQRRDAVD